MKRHNYLRNILCDVLILIIFLLFCIAFLIFNPIGEMCKLEYDKVSFDKIKNWGKDYNLVNFITPFKESCEKFNEKKDTDIITDNPIKTTAKQWKVVCDRLLKVDLKNNLSIQNFIENNFTAYRLGDNGSSHITSYYRIELKGSRSKTENYKYPIYKLPSDLIKVNLETFIPDLKRTFIFGRAENGNLIPYYSRAEIENGQLKNKNLELLWFDDKYDIFLLHVQGSGIVTLGDGEQLYVSYAGKNGLKFSGITNYIDSDFKAKFPNLSMIDIVKKFFKEYPNKVDEILNHNQSFIFFRISNKSDWVGTLGTSLYAERTVAVDPAYEALGIPLWISLLNPRTNEEINHMVVANDTGSAIKGMGRIDFYAGLGKEAGETASRINQYNTTYMFLPNNKN